MNIFKLLLPISMSFFVFCCIGCDKKEDPKDIEEEYIEVLGQFGVEGIEGFLSRFELPKDVKQRGEFAMTLWRNEELDPSPILICATIKKDNEDVPRMGMYFSDEDRDVVGFGIREVHKVASSEDQAIEATYPVFEHLSPPVVWICQFEIEIRTSGVNKNMELWNDFISDPNAETLPPIIASIPDPNNVDVWVWLYDRAGNQSKPVKAIKEIKEK